MAVPEGWVWVVAEAAAVTVVAAVAVVLTVCSGGLAWGWNRHEDEAWAGVVGGRLGWG